MIKIIDGKKHYYDKDGIEITVGSKIKYPSGHIKEVYLSNTGDLGTDATNPEWIESGRAEPLEWGVLPLMVKDTYEVEVVI